LPAASSWMTRTVKSPSVSAVAVTENEPSAMRAADGDCAGVPLTAVPV
jgi:hypothetical protein